MKSKLQRSRGAWLTIMFVLLMVGTAIAGIVSKLDSGRWPLFETLLDLLTVGFWFIVVFVLMWVFYYGFSRIFFGIMIAISDDGQSEEPDETESEEK